MQQETLDRLHSRYLVQATWTALIREQLFDSIRIQATHKVLEVGSGTGVVSAEITHRFPVECIGVDIDRSVVTFAHNIDPGSSYLAGDGCNLPLQPAAFDITVCHFLLLWVENPEKILNEMARVTKPGGWILALAEPDYGGRIDFPRELEAVGQRQIQALLDQGANPYLGRTLRSLFVSAQLTEIRTGLLGGEWQGSPGEAQLDSEWETLARDLNHLLPAGEIENYKRIDRKAWEMGTRVLFVPTFYAAGRVAPLRGPAQATS
ncbi:MAG: methyltransferase domain-containing protein [Anaerolineales bacterium]|nr:methyltransferase domain-containing protein [Anaerolineales bacterium]MCK5635697.1 methyltransferase domain-containing protein [Anaerolineales bacterium]